MNKINFVKISVIVPTYNEEEVIGECIASLKNQSLKDIEIIVVDDGSTDSSKFKIKNSKLKIKNLEFLEQKHQGPAMARNLGASYAKGKVLVFVDSDMVFDKDFIKNLTEPILEGKVKGTFSKDEFVANWSNIWAKCWNINSNLPSQKRLPNNYPDYQKVFRAILKSEFEKVNGFSKGGYTDDWTLSEKLGYEAQAVGNAIFYHKNPDTLAEVYKQAKWIGKRKYKLGVIGHLAALARSSFLISLLVGFYKGIKNNDLRFMIFKFVYDFGIFVGIIEMILTGKTAK